MDNNNIREKNIKNMEAYLSEISFSNLNILITGGAGFLGSWMCDVLVNNQANIVCLDNLSSGQIDNIAHLRNIPNFKFVKHDIIETIEFDQKLDLVVHMASRASPFEFTKFPLEILRANTLGTMNALEIARKHKARLLYTSTSEIYGEPAIVPTPESYRGNVSSTGIRSCYDEGKRCGEAIVIAYGRQYGLDVRIARIFNTFGPRMRGDDIYGRVVPRFIDQCMVDLPITVFGTGKQTRSFCYVTDQIEGLLRLASYDGMTGKIINIGNDNETSILDLAYLIKELTNSNSDIIYMPLPEDDPTRRCPEISTARTFLQWEPRTKLADGLNDFIKWLQNKKKVSKTN